ncbi:MAG: preprotein translocase subunit Sec61beta [Candidatus Altiarchaeales archaeon]|nr:preprotein translocase subunit Sec61beta [Candidatus Altiarchaeales archaeon]
MPVLKKRKTDGIAGGAGLIRYFDVDEGGPKMDPKLVVGIVVAMIILELLASIMFS